MVPTKLRVSVGQHNLVTGHALAADLRKVGCQPLRVATTATELIQHARDDKPDLLVADIRLAEGDGIAASDAVYRERPLPIILLSAHVEREMVQRAEAGHALAYLKTPIEPAELDAAIRVAVSRFKRIRELEQESEELKQQLEERKLVDRAKGIIMKMLRLEEEDAYRRMRKHASNHNLKVVDVAKRIIEAEGPFRELEGR